MMKKMVGQADRKRVERSDDQRVFAVQMRLLSPFILWHSRVCRITLPPSPWAMDCLLVIQATAKFPAGMATAIPPCIPAHGYHMRGGVQPLLVHRLRVNMVDPHILQGNFATGPIESATHGHCHCYLRSMLVAPQEIH